MISTSVALTPRLRQWNHPRSPVADSRFFHPDATLPDAGQHFQHPAPGVHRGHYLRGDDPLHSQVVVTKIHLKNGMRIIEDLIVTAKSRCYGSIIQSIKEIHRQDRAGTPISDLVEARAEFSVRFQYGGEHAESRLPYSKNPRRKSGGKV